MDNMKLLIKKFMLITILMLSNINAWATSYNYSADVKGMVCAYCAYSVNRSISTLPGVDAESVDVNLRQGFVTFSSIQEVSESKISEVFSESGFTISNLKQTEKFDAVTRSTMPPLLDISIDVLKIDGFKDVVEAIGKVAASTPSRLVIKAPTSYENDILKSLLMGRQQVIKINFTPVESGTINIKLFKFPALK